MNGAVHLDIRNGKNYVNAHWFGDERTGENYIATFSQYLPKIIETTKHKITVIIDGKTVYESEV
jgi:hypothetical protein